MKKVIFVLFVSLTIFITACSNETNMRNKLAGWDPSQYTVQHGDTLYSLAWRYNLDFKDVAHWNKIKAPFTIFPGQRLKMTGPIIEPEDKTYLFGQPQKAKPNNPKLSMYQATEPVPDYSDIDNIPQAPPLNNKKNLVKPAPKNIKSRPVYNRKKTKVHRTANKPSLPKGNIKWSWPIKGKVISTYAANSTDRKGIDIKGFTGQKIKSAGDGVVVYSGSGLISYGQLIIIKHSDRFLSAYAYNKKLLVKEGTRVKKGQMIAIIGKNLNVTNLLHFEIRKDGKPVNPLVYLP